MRKITLLSAVLTFILTSSTWAADISGKWTLSMWGAGAQESFPMVIKASGEKFTVAATHPSFKEMTGTGTLKGDAISFNLKSSAMEIGFSGKVAGNKMEGTREIKASGEGRGGGAPGGAAPQGGMPEGAPQGGMPQGGAQGGAPGGAPPQGGMPEGAGQGGAPGGAPPQGGMSAGAGQGGAPAGGISDQGNENFTAVKN